MKIAFSLIVLLLFSAPLYGHTEDLNLKKRTINTRGLKLTSAFLQIEDQFDVKINVQGALNDAIVQNNLTNITLKDAVITILKDSNILNYALSIDSKNNKISINILKQNENNNVLFPIYAKQTKKNNLMQLNGSLEIEKEENYKKMFTFEEIEALKEDAKKLTQNKEESANTFTQEQIEQLQRETMNARKDGDIVNEEILAFNIEQLYSKEAIIEEEISQEHLNLLRQ